MSAGEPNVIFIHRGCGGVVALETEACAKCGPMAADAVAERHTACTRCGADCGGITLSGECASCQKRTEAARSALRYRDCDADALYDRARDDAHIESLTRGAK